MLDCLCTLLEDQVKDLYNAEKQMTKALPKMARKATHPELRAALESHLKETRTHVDRLAKVAGMLEVTPTGKACKAMKGLVEEGKEAIEETGDPSVIDAALIATAKRVEHYEIAAYTYAVRIAERLGRDDIAAVLLKTLEEESNAEDTLETISDSFVLPKAASASQTELAQPRPKSRKPASKARRSAPRRRYAASRD